MTSNTQTKPLRKHGACLSCRHRKLKCDGSKPTCTVCIRDGRECQYVEKTQARNRTIALEERLEALQRQLSFLTSRKVSQGTLDKSSLPRTEASTSNSLPPFLHRSQSSQAPMQGSQPVQDQSYYNSNVLYSNHTGGNGITTTASPTIYPTSSIFPSEMLTSEPPPMTNPFGSQLQTPELEMTNSLGREDSSGSSSSMQSTPATHLNSMSSSSSLAMTGPGAANPKASPLQGLDELSDMPGILELRSNNGLPDLLTFTELASVYFEKVEPLFVHFPHRNRFLVKAFGRLLTPQVAIPSGERALIFAVCAQGAARSDKYPHLAKPFSDLTSSAIGEYLHALGDGSSASSRMFYAFSDSPTQFLPPGYTQGKEDLLQLIQANILLGGLSCSICMYNIGWLHLGIAENLSQICGLDTLDQETRDSLWVGQMKTYTSPPCLAPPVDWIEEEERRRTWWALWAFARFMGHGTTYVSRVPVNGLTQKLPCDERAWQEEWTERPTQDIDELNLARLQIETINITSHVGIFIKSLENEGKEQANSLPDFGLTIPRQPSFTQNRAEKFLELDRAITKQKLKVPKTYAIAGNYMIYAGLLIAQITLYAGIACPARRTTSFGNSIRADGTDSSGLPTPHEARERLLQAAKGIVALIGPLSDFTDMNTMGPYMSMPFAVAMDCLQRSPKLKTDPSVKEDLAVLKLWMNKLKDKWPKAKMIIERIESYAKAARLAEAEGHGTCPMERMNVPTEEKTKTRAEMFAPPSLYPRPSNNTFSSGSTSSAVDSPWSSTSDSSGPPRKFSLVDSSPGSLPQASPLASYLDAQMMTSEAGETLYPPNPMSSQSQLPMPPSGPEDGFKNMGGIWQGFDLHTGLTPAPTASYVG